MSPFVGRTAYLWMVTLSGFASVDLALVLEPCTTRPYRLDEIGAPSRADFRRVKMTIATAMSALARANHCMETH